MTQDFSTRAIHAGQDFDPTTGAIVPPLHLSTTYAQDGVGGLRGGFEYTRTGNPTRSVLEAQVAALEQAQYAHAFASGLAAEDALYRAILKSGDHIIISPDIYGGSFRLIAGLYQQWGLECSVVDQSDPENVRQAIRPNTRLVRIETPGNPLLGITDIRTVTAIAREAGILSVVDNTFASPVLQQPLELGADLSLHSSTKYLSGHSDTLGGVVIHNSAELAEKVKSVQSGIGAVLAPFDAWLTTRGIKTLELRVRQHTKNAGMIAARLAEHGAVTAVHYPGLPDHPGHRVAGEQMSGFGGMLSFELESPEAAKRFANSLSLFQLAGSLGGVESLICYPAEMTHASVQGTELEVPGTLLRLSVGIEAAEDLWADLAEGLAAL